MDFKRQRVIKAVYDFSVSGGTTGDITLGRYIPSNFIVTNIYHKENTNVTSGGSATVTLSAGSTALTGAIAKATFNGVNSEALASSATAINISTACELKITIGTADLTAGKVTFYVVGIVE